jgi:hypothetical protein
MRPNDDLEVSHDGLMMSTAKAERRPPTGDGSRECYAVAFVGSYLQKK